MLGLKKHYGIQADKLSMEDYLYYAGAVHGLILGYSLEAIRFKDFCAGAIFWMYNDTWGRGRLDNCRLLFAPQDRLLWREACVCTAEGDAARP